MWLTETKYIMRTAKKLHETETGNCWHLFTLIELLVVVVIIMILMSILLPALKGAMEKGRITACKNNQKQIALGLSSYASEWDQWGPQIYWGNGNAYYVNCVKGYLHPSSLPTNARLLQCPSRNGGLATGPYRAGATSGSFIFSSYNLSFGFGDRVNADGSLKDFYGWTMQAVASISSVIIAKCPRLQMAGTTVMGHYILPPSQLPVCGDIASLTGLIDGYGMTASMSHKTGANDLFLDGHCTWVPQVRFSRYVSYYTSINKIYTE
ncbi:MAG: hypothetical protein A2X49_13195 [Lentisphaerae bacterium GWF2_52_8]|nr:MAG: hypothetical protein A2X49_13195 [Lentisphaerae bacterium GWF2_52_8]